MVLFLQIWKENPTLLLFVEHIVILQNLIPIDPLSLFSHCLFQMFKTATGNRIVSPRINCRNRLLHISQKLIIRRKCDPGALQRHRGEVIQACDRNFLCLCLIVRPDEERHSIKILQFILCQPRQTFSVQPFVKIRVQTRLVIPEKDDLHRIIHALEIADEIFQRLIALMKQRQILIRIGITCSECPDLAH